MAGGKKGADAWFLRTSIDGIAFLSKIMKYLIVLLALGYPLVWVTQGHDPIGVSVPVDVGGCAGKDGVTGRDEGFERVILRCRGERAG
jgi:hypothetical protein